MMTTLRILNAAQHTLLNDPLEQFEVVSVLSLGGVNVFNNLSLTFLLNLVLIATLLGSYDLNMTNNYAFATRSIYKLVQSMVKENLYIKKQQYFAVLFYLFLTLLFANLVGLLPYAFTITSSFVVTLFISILHFVAVNIVGGHRHR
jgi:F0F1-type ATP synthase membrane subunit a